MILRIALLILLVCYACVPSRAQRAGAHGYQHAENHHWYQTLKRPGSGVSCCSDIDCGVTRARYVEGHWEALFEGRWMSIPADRVLAERSPDGRAHICAAKNAREPFCFIPPDPDY